jgi:hypothetical protein
MSEIQELEITIDRYGNVKVEVDGVTGTKCEALTKPLEQALGGQVLERTYKDSYYEQPAEDDDVVRTKT